MGVCNLLYMYYVSSQGKKSCVRNVMIKKNKLGGSLYHELMYTFIKLKPLIVKLVLFKLTCKRELFFIDI